MWTQRNCPISKHVAYITKKLLTTTKETNASRPLQRGAERRTMKLMKRIDEIEDRLESQNRNINRLSNEIRRTQREGRNMECKNKELFVKGIKKTGTRMGYKTKTLRVMVTNDQTGKTLSVSDGDTIFTFPADEISRWLER